MCTLLFWRSLIREFEKEARADGQDANAVQRKKTVRVPHRCLLSRRTEAQRLRCPRHTGSDGPKPCCGTFVCVPPVALQDLVNQLNKFVAQKKKKTDELETKKVSHARAAQGRQSAPPGGVLASF